MYPEQLHPAKAPTALVISGAGGRRRALLPRPTLSRSTPIRTTALPFVVGVSPEGVKEVRIAG
jgi:hypothetical protein